MAIALSQGRTISPARAPARASGSALDWIGKGMPFRRQVSRSELIFFNSQLSLMMEIGLPLTNALRAMVAQTKNAVFRDIMEIMVKDLEEGRQLSDAMSRYPEIFDTVYTSMVRAGEAGGFLKKTLDAIIAMQEKRQVLVTQLRSTLTYPVILCTMSLGVVVFVLVGVLPKFQVLFEGKEAVLPFNTRFLMAASISLRTYWWGYLLSCAGVVAGFIYFVRSSHGRALADRVVIAAPVIGRVTNKIYTCRLLRTLGYLMESSVTLVHALAVTQPTFRNRHYREFVAQLKGRVEEGERFSRFFVTSPYILESVKQMISTGEEVGELTRVMLRLADFYDTEVDRELKMIGALISPLALMAMGTVVALIVSSVVLPMFRIAAVVQ